MMFNTFVSLVIGFLIGALCTRLVYEYRELKGCSVKDLKKENERLKYFLRQRKPKAR